MVEFAKREIRVRHFGRLTHDELRIVDPGQALETGTEVDGVADDRVGDTIPRPHVADIHDAGVDPDPEVDRRPLPFREPGIHAIQCAQHRDAGVHRPYRMVVLRQRRSPERHDRIAHVFVDGRAVAVQNIRHFGEIEVEHLGQLARVELLRDGGEIPNVAEQHGQFPRLAVQRIRLRFAADRADDLRRYVLPEYRYQFLLIVGLNEVGDEHIDRKQHQYRQQGVFHRDQGAHPGICILDIERREHQRESRNRGLDRVEHRQQDRKDDTDANECKEIGSQQRRGQESGAEDVAEQVGAQLGRSPAAERDLEYADRVQQERYENNEDQHRVGSQPTVSLSERHFFTGTRRRTGLPGAASRAGRVWRAELLSFSPCRAMSIIQQFRPIVLKNRHICSFGDSAAAFEIR